MGFSAARRNGIGRLSFRFRAVLLDDAGGEVAVVSSPARAEQIAGLLNAASQGNLPPKVGSDASYPHYEATTLEGKRVVLRAEWQGDLEVVIQTRDAELAEKVAGLLERVDPAMKVRIHGPGIRWW